jgi:hypothetical protein
MRGYLFPRPTASATGSRNVNGTLGADVSVSVVGGAIHQLPHTDLGQYPAIAPVAADTAIGRHIIMGSRMVHTASKGLKDGNRTEQSA